MLFFIEAITNYLIVNSTNFIIVGSVLTAERENQQAISGRVGLILLSTNLS